LLLTDVNIDSNDRIQDEPRTKAGQQRTTDHNKWRLWLWECGDVGAEMLVKLKHFTCPATRLPDVDKLEVFEVWIHLHAMSCSIPQPLGAFAVRNFTTKQTLQQIIG